MEAVLDVYKRIKDSSRPLVCMDECPKQLIGETRPPMAVEPGKPERFDTEYVRNGTCNLCVTHTTDTLHFFDSLLVLGTKNGLATVVYHDAPDRLLGSFGVNSLPDLFDALQGGTIASEDEKTALRFGKKRDKDDESGATSKAALSHIPSATYKRPETDGWYLFAQLKTVAWRTALSAWRDRGGTMVNLGLPVFLAFLIVFTQSRQSDSSYASFFIIVAALWMGMTLSVRGIVKERKLYVRDRLAGLSPIAFMGGKVAFTLFSTLSQAVLLVVGVRWLMYFADILGVANQSLYGDPAVFPYYGGLVVVAAVGLGGSLLGLCASTVAASEQTAVGALPLILLPQVLISKVATGEGGKLWLDPAVFAKVNVAMEYIAKGTQSAVGDIQGFAGQIRDGVLFVSSLLLFTRPATAALDLHVQHTGWQGDVLVEFLHVVLLLAAYLALWGWLFFRCEKKWSIR